MTAEQLIIGNKYVPFQKTIGDDFNNSTFVRQSLDFIYYKGTNDEGKHMFGKNESGIGGAFYNPEDVYEYIEECNGISKGMAVCVTDSGETYTSYRDKFKELMFKDKERNDSWSDGTEGIVFGISKTSDNRVIFAVRHSSGKECLISEAGVRLVDDVVENKPTKWAIKVNPYNRQALTDWRGFTIGSIESYLLCDIPQGELHNLPNNRGYSVQNLNDYPEYTLITDEQFYFQIINKPQTMPQTPQDAPQDAPQETKQYPKTAEGLYQMTVDLLAFEVGDTVRVTHKVPDHYNGWQNCWSDSMDVFIGREYKIEGIFETGIQLEYSDGYKFPIYSLELVRRKEPIRTHTLSFTDTDGTMTDGDEFVYFNNPITKLSGSDVFWLVKLLVMAGVDKKYSVSTNVVS
jgi:hypothetical protein